MDDMAGFDVPEVSDVPEMIDETPEIPDTSDNPVLEEPEGLGSTDIPEEIPEVPEPGPSDTPQPDNDWITIHPGIESPEVLPNPEIEPVSIPDPEGKKPEPPEGWHPGGPEGGW